MRICQLSAEHAPYAKTGGLGDAVAGLTRFLARAGNDVRAFLPFYAAMEKDRGRFVPVDFIRDVEVTLGPWQVRFTAWTDPAASDTGGPGIYFIDCPALFGHGGIYHGDREDALRFCLLARAALASCQRMGWSPDILHCHDWHAALAPLLLRAAYSWDRLFERTRTVLTLHNVAFQGLVDRGRIADLGLGEYASWLHPGDLAAGRLNLLRTGLRTADALTAVSRTFAREIRTPELGFGLDGDLRAAGDRLIGIVNGVDYGTWDPANDPHLPHRYGADDLTGKAQMRAALLGEIGLSAGPAVPVLGVVSRLTVQKGFDLCFEALPWLLATRDVRLVALGSGETRYEEFFAGLTARFPGKAWFYRGFNEPLAHWIEAGADLFLMPSKFEPCGLNQLYSLRYGTPPVVHRTGGLADTVELFDAETGRGTGFVFDHFSPEGLAWALSYALDLFPHRTIWRQLQANGMAKDYSWDVQGQEYLALYRRLTGG
jgi:starch synthase